MEGEGVGFKFQLLEAQPCWFAVYQWRAEKDSLASQSKFRCRILKLTLHRPLAAIETSPSCAACACHVRSIIARPLWPLDPVAANTETFLPNTQPAGWLWSLADCPSVWPPTGHILVVSWLSNLPQYRSGSLADCLSNLPQDRFWSLADCLSDLPQERFWSLADCLPSHRTIWVIGWLSNLPQDKFGWLADCLTSHRTDFGGWPIVCLPNLPRDNWLISIAVLFGFSFALQDSWLVSRDGRIIVD